MGRLDPSWPQICSKKVSAEQLGSPNRPSMETMHMKTAEKYDVLVFGGGTAGKVMAWTMAKEGKRTAVVDRKYIGGSCPNVACLPSKNVIHSAKVASLVERHREFGIETGAIAIDMAAVYARKRKMVDDIVQFHLDKYHAVLDLRRGDELIF